jgi:hypothetical protein
MKCLAQTFEPPNQLSPLGWVEVKQGVELFAGGYQRAGAVGGANEREARRARALSLQVLVPCPESLASEYPPPHAPQKARNHQGHQEHGGKANR